MCSALRQAPALSSPPRKCSPPTTAGDAALPGHVSSLQLGWDLTELYKAPGSLLQRLLPSRAVALTRVPLACGSLEGTEPYPSSQAQTAPPELPPYSGLPPANSQGRCRLLLFVVFRWWEG